MNNAHDLDAGHSEGMGIGSSPPKDASGSEQIADIPALEGIDESKWRIAMRRWETIKPIVESGRPYGQLVVSTSREKKVSAATLYRWIDQYRSRGDTLALLPRTAKRRKSKLSGDILEIIRETFDDCFATKQRRSVIAAVREVQYKCHQRSVLAPHENTIRKHLERMRDLIGQRVFLRRRGQEKRSDDNFALRDGKFSEQEAPWFRVQIDHTRLDVMVVDETHRRSIGRAYLTYAIDSYSRMIVGFNISLDPSGRLSTGLCMLHAMLPKEPWLKEHGVPNTWPCYGKPGTLHFDNGKEFLSEWIQRACQRYDILIEHRPVATPHFGPQIERSIRTLNTFLRELPGATFSNPADRDEYDSEGLAIFTLFELESQITEWITGTYHRRIHKGIRRTPQARYDEAILGTPETLGSGRRIFAHDERRLRLDFMPCERRTVQHYGVTFDTLVYSGEALSPYVGATDENGRSKRFFFHRDPRRINEIYFYAEDVNEFYPLTLNEPQQDISLWEWQAQLRQARLIAEGEVDQDALFESHARLRRREEEAAAKTKSARRNVTRRLHHSNVTPLPSLVVSENADIGWEEDIRPFDGIRSL